MSITLCLYVIERGPRLTYQSHLELLSYLSLWHVGLRFKTHRVLLVQSHNAGHVALHARHHARVVWSNGHHFVHLGVASRSVWGL